MVKLGKAMQCHFNREPSAVEISTFSRDKSRCTSELHWGRFFFFNDFVSRLPTLQNRCPHSPFLLSPSPQWSVYSLLNPVDVFTVFNHHHVTMSPMSSQYPWKTNLSSPSRPTDPSTLRKFPGRCRSHGAAGRPPWSAAQWAARPCGARNAKIADL